MFLGSSPVAVTSTTVLFLRKSSSKFNLSPYVDPKYIEVKKLQVFYFREEKENFSRIL